MTEVFDHFVCYFQKSKAPSPLVKATLAWKEPDTDNVVVKEDTPAAKLDVDAVSSVSSSSIES